MTRWRLMATGHRTGNFMIVIVTTQAVAVA